MLILSYLGTWVKGLDENQEFIVSIHALSEVKLIAVCAK